jgi:hypothetical protein
VACVALAGWPHPWEAWPLTHRELRAEQKGPSCWKSLGEIPVLLQTEPEGGRERVLSAALQPGDLLGEAILGPRVDGRWRTDHGPAVPRLLH